MFSLYNIYTFNIPYFFTNWNARWCYYIHAILMNMNFIFISYIFVFLFRKNVKFLTFFSTKASNYAKILLPRAEFKKILKSRKEKIGPLRRPRNYHLLCVYHLSSLSLDISQDTVDTINF